MGPKNRYHFSHNENANCSQESVLHKTAKYLLEANIKESSKPTVSWDCPTCQKPHSSDLFATTTTLCVEQHLGTCKPDITARAENGVIKAFIEVVVRHDPEPYVYETAKALSIPVIEFRLKKIEELQELREKELKASKVSICITPKCQKCGQPLESKSIMLWEFQCWQCKQRMPFAWADWNGVFQSPEQFSDEEIRLATEAGAKIEFRYSKMAGCSYHANICPFCYALQGDFYLHDHLCNLDAQISQVEQRIDTLKSLGFPPSAFPRLPRTIHSSLACLRCA